jgi:NDP-sugar pyrophosphorylase family protein
VTRIAEAMIVAGGAGTRLRPLTRSMPKPLLPFCGAPFLSGVIRRLAAVGVERVLLIVGPDPSPFDVLRADARDHGVEVEAVPEPEPLDTAGGVREALDRVSGPFLVLNGDILTDVDVSAALEAHERAAADATLVLTRVEDTSTFGVVVREGGRVRRFVEKPAPGTLPGHDTVNAGTYVLDPDALAQFPRGRLSFEREVFPRLLEQGAHIEGWVGSGVWADLGTPDRFLEGHRLALDGELRWPSFEDVPERSPGVRCAASATISPDARLEGPVLIGARARVEAGATVGPHVVLGEGSQVGAGAALRDSVLFDGVSLGAQAFARGLLAGHHARVGDRASAEHGAVLGDGAVVADDERLPPGARRPDES